MSLNNFSTANNIVTVNGRQIQDWGQADPAITEAQIDDKSALIRGQGGNATRLDRINPGRTVTLALQPGSADATYLQALFESNANITYTRQVVGTLETSFGDQGVCTSDGQSGRAGQTITDNIFTFQFNQWTGAK